MRALGLGLGAAAGLTASAPNARDASADPYANARVEQAQRAPRPEMPAGVTLRTPLPERPASTRDAPHLSDSGPLFGEEGFGDPDVPQRPAGEARMAGGEAMEAEGESDENPLDRNELESQRRRELSQAHIAAIRQQAAAAQAQQQQEQEAKEGERSPADATIRDGTDMGINLLAYELPVVGHLLWWNVKMVYGGWIRKDAGRFVGSFGWQDVILAVKPVKTGERSLKQALAKILPDFTAHFGLVLVDLILAVAVLLLIFFQIMLMYGLYLALTDPLALLGLASEFGGIFTGIF